MAGGFIGSIEDAYQDSGLGEFFSWFSWKNFKKVYKALDKLIPKKLKVMLRSQLQLFVDSFTGGAYSSVKYWYDETVGDLTKTLRDGLVSLGADPTSAISDFVKAVDGIEDIANTGADLSKMTDKQKGTYAVAVGVIAKAFGMTDKEAEEIIAGIAASTLSDSPEADKIIPVMERDLTSANGDLEQKWIIGGALALGAIMFFPKILGR